MLRALTALLVLLATGISSAAIAGRLQSGKRQAVETSTRRETSVSTEPTAPRPMTYEQARHLTFLILGIIFIAWFGQWLVSQISEVLTLLTISVILAVALRPTVDKMSHDRIPFLNRTTRRVLAVVVLYLGIATVIATLFLLVVPQLVVEGEKFIANGPAYMQNLDDFISGLRESYPWIPLTSDLAGLSSQLTRDLFSTLPEAFGFLFVAISTLSGLLSLGVILIITLYLIVEADPLYNHVVLLLPPSRRGHVREMSAKMGIKIEGWLKGVVILSLSIGIPTGLFMWVIGMPFPLLLGVLAGLFELIPLVGAYLGAAPAVALALFQPTWMLVAVIAFFFVLQMAENNILAPGIMGSQVDLPPLLVIVALLIGAALHGILGALLAVPLAGVVQVLWTDLVVPSIKGRYVEQKDRAVRQPSGGPPLP